MRQGLIAVVLMVLAGGTAVADSAKDTLPQFTIVGDGGRCDDVDIPDASARAFRSASGAITVFATHYVNRAFRGSNFSTLSKQCRISYEGSLNVDSASFDYKTWIASTWADSGGDVYALGHNEYQAHEIPGKCHFSNYSSCWYNSVVLLKSSDDGRNFQKIEDRTKKAVLAPNFTDQVGQGHPRGFTSPTNLVKWNGYLYTLVGYSGAGLNERGRCLLRTALPISLNSWEILTESGFHAPNQTLYSGSKVADCKEVVGFKGFVGSISKIRNSDWFVALVAEDDNTGGHIRYYFSQDLINWGNKKNLMDLSLFWSKSCDGGAKYSYPSLIDPASQSKNFDDVSERPYLFLVRSSCEAGKNRQLVRIPVKLDISEYTSR